MDTVIESKKLIKYGSNKEYVAVVHYLPSSSTHTITYKGDFKKGFLLKDLAPFFIEIFGESFLSAVGEIPGSLLIVTWLFFSVFLISIATHYNFESAFFLLLYLAVLELLCYY